MFKFVLGTTVGFVAGSFLTFTVVITNPEANKALANAMGDWIADKLEPHLFTK